MCTFYTRFTRRWFLTTECFDNRTEFLEMFLEKFEEKCFPATILTPLSTQRKQHFNPAVINFISLSKSQPAPLNSQALIPLIFSLNRFNFIPFLRGLRFDIFIYTFCVVFSLHDSTVGWCVHLIKQEERQENTSSRSVHAFRRLFLFRMTKFDEVFKVPNDKREKTFYRINTTIDWNAFKLFNPKTLNGFQSAFPPKIRVNCSSSQIDFRFHF